MRLPIVSLVVLEVVGGSAQAADITVTLEIPRLQVAEYHRPYVALWLEDKSRKSVTNLAVWYDFKMKDDEGTKWLKDMRQWWRTTGRDLKMPVDGITSATRAPGEHTVTFRGAGGPLAALPTGKYELLIEAAREVGGRELLRLAVEWPPTKLTEASLKGEHELGAIKVKLVP